MLGWLGDRRWRKMAFIGMTLHLVFLMTSPFEHHDLLCHLKTPFHCTSCASSALSSDPSTPAVVGQWHLAEAGRAFALVLAHDSAILAVSSPGRSPPRFA